MKYLRSSVPILGMVALAMMFLKLPEISGFFQCKACFPTDPYMPLFGCGYFAVLTAVSLLFPSFPGNMHLARGGLIWSILLCLGLTYTKLPLWCALCLVAHACHILIWTIWYLMPVESYRTTMPVEMRLFLILFAPLSAVALFSSLNLTVMAYSYKTVPKIVGFQVGDEIPDFRAETVHGREIVYSGDEGLVLNFVSSGCPHCKEQLKILHSLKLNPSYRIVIITPIVSPELMQYLPEAEWIEDKDYQLQKLFRIQGSPTLYIVENDGKIARIILGVPDKLKDDLQICLAE